MTHSVPAFSVPRLRDANTPSAMTRIAEKATRRTMQLKKKRPGAPAPTAPDRAGNDIRVPSRAIVAMLSGVPWAWRKRKPTRHRVASRLAGYRKLRYRRSHVLLRDDPPRVSTTSPWRPGDILAIGLKSVSAWLDHNASSLGAALAYYTLFS
jgi:hypothetical protein